MTEDSPEGTGTLHARSRGVEISEGRIRLAEPGDATAVAAIYGPIVERTAISLEEDAPSVDEMRARIEATIETWPWLVLELGGAVLGYVYAGRHRERSAYRWSVDVTAYVREDARGRGVGRSLYTILFRVLREQRFHRAFAGIGLPNDASIALHRAVGFEPVGIYREVGYKFGAWRDVSWWTREIAPAVIPPPEPIPLSAFSHDALRGLLAPE
jgi:phosphinothricin acetyltransferase